MWINPKIHFKPCAFATGCLSNEQNAYFLPLPTIFVLILGYVASAYSFFPTQISHGRVGFAVVTILTLKRPWLNITKVCFSITHMHCWVGGMRSAPCATRSLRMMETLLHVTSYTPDRMARRWGTTHRLPSTLTWNDIGHFHSHFIA